MLEASVQGHGLHAPHKMPPECRAPRKLSRHGLSSRAMRVLPASTLARLAASALTAATPALLTAPVRAQALVVDHGARRVVWEDGRGR